MVATHILILSKIVLNFYQQTTCSHNCWRNCKRFLGWFCGDFVQSGRFHGIFPIKIDQMQWVQMLKISKSKLQSKLSNGMFLIGWLPCPSWKKRISFDLEEGLKLKYRFSCFSSYFGTNWGEDFNGNLRLARLSWFELIRFSQQGQSIIFLCFFFSFYFSFYSIFHSSLTLLQRKILFLSGGDPLADFPSVLI